MPLVAKSELSSEQHTIDNSEIAVKSEPTNRFTSVQPCRLFVATMVATYLLQAPRSKKHGAFLTNFKLTQVIMMIEYLLQQAKLYELLKAFATSIH